MIKCLSIRTPEFEKSLKKASPKITKKINELIERTIRNNLSGEIEEKFKNMEIADSKKKVENVISNLRESYSYKEKKKGHNDRKI